MDYTTIYKAVEDHVTALHEKNLKKTLVYHTLQHTKTVVDRAREISANYQLIENDLLAIYVAAWFHDTGYLVGDADMHEKRGADLMRAFMQQHTTDADLLKTIEDCILSTRYFADPYNLLQEIICDAESYYFGTIEFKEISVLLYQEIKLRDAVKNKLLWDKDMLVTLKRHRYYTSYCIDLLTGQKAINLKKLKKSVKKIEESPEITKDTPAIIREQDNFTTKGIQTMLRLTSENHMKLSDMADGKANILISVNSIIISVIITVLLRRLQDETFLTIPTIIFLSFTLITIILSILATRPGLNRGTFSDQDIIDKKTNLLFFGHYHKTPFDVYEKAMQQMMMEPDYLYRTLVKDIYQQGVVLARKFKLIRLAYNCFMIGIIISVLAFAIAVFVGNASETIIVNSSGLPF